MARTKDFMKVLDKRLRQDPELAVLVDAELVRSSIARQIYAARTQRHLSQQSLAKRAGIRRSVIADIEDADFDGDTILALARIAKAMKLQVFVSFERGSALNRP
ncbi:MAG: helix-turn-helix transcriptional regulator [Planctomycetia bacterium]|nr:helix-turn-helix transcriptional regulator [Planctomycetia bacterium]